MLEDEALLHGGQRQCRDEYEDVEMEINRDRNREEEVEEYGASRDEWKNLWSSRKAYR
jgi:hypothetical protein